MRSFQTEKRTGSGSMCAPPLLRASCMATKSTRKMSRQGDEGLSTPSSLETSKVPANRDEGRNSVDLSEQEGEQSTRTDLRTSKTQDESAGLSQEGNSNLCQLSSKLEATRLHELGSSEEKEEEDILPVWRWWFPGRYTDGSMTALDMLTDLSIQVYCVIHVLALLTVLFLPPSPRLLLLCWASYVLRMFGITAGYHRLLSHRSFKTSRGMQFLLAVLGCSSFQKGPLWWASQHRHHHRTADTKEDAHSPVQYGFFWSHMGWFLLSSNHTQVLWGAIPDLACLPELRLLELFHWLPSLLLGAALLALGGVPAVGWGFMVSTVVCWHFTYCINSLAHVVGSRRFRCEFNTHCDARNNFWLALVTLGEGWHNNHHCYMRSARHGFYAHEIDVTWYALTLASQVGLVWDLELPPVKMLEARRYDTKHLRCRCELMDSDMQETIKCQSGG